MNKDDVKKRASLSWDLEDYKALNEEPPSCLFFGKTEGEVLEEEGIAEWLSDQLQGLSVLREDYPVKFEEQFNYYVLDLEYLFSLGKITADELLELKKKENIGFGQAK